MRQPALTALFLLVALHCAPALRAQEVGYERFTLDNGLTVIFHEDHSVPEVCVNLWYHVGSKDEQAGRSGFAHLFEHLMFMGTKRVPGAEFDLLMEARGGQNNASTAEDRTNYYATGPAELLPTLLWLEADRMEALGQAMTQAKLDKQRDVVRNERRQSYENAPYGKASLRVYQEMFPVGHPYHLPVIGSHADLEAATVEDVKRFFATYYVPSNASLVVAGDFDPDLTKPLVERLFGSIARGADPRHAESQTAALRSTRRVTMTDRVQFARTSLVYHSPPFLQAGDAEMDLIADVLTDGVSSRLYQRLVVQHQLASAVSAYQESMALGSLFRIQATARPGVELEELEREIDAVISELVRRGPSKRELRQKQAQLEYRTLARLQSLQAKADQLNAYQFHRGEPDSFRWDLDRYRSATPAEVRRWAARVLRPEARLVLNVLPEPARADTNPRDSQPAVGAAEPFTPPAPETFKLGNGVTVHHWSRRELPLVKVRLLLPFGAASDPVGRGGLAALTAEMLDEGTGKLDAAGVAKALELLGASVQSGCDQETTEVDLSTLRRNLEPALGILADVVQRPRLDPDEWTRVQRVHVEQLRRAQDHPSYVAYTVARRRFFGDAHPYSRPSDGTPESATAVTLDDVRRFHSQLYRPRQTTLLVAGDLSAEEARRLLEESFGGWAPATTTPELEAPSFPTATGRRPQLVIVHRPGAVQTVIQFFMPAPRYQDPRRPKLELVNTILGGSFTSRLNQNLRERNGYTYGARSNLAMEPSAGYFSASSSVHTEVTGAALREFLNELGRMKRESITAEEARKTKALRRMDVVQTFSGLGGVLWAGSILVRNQRPFSELGEELRSIERVGERDLNQVAATMAPLEQSVLVLVGDKTKILPQLKGFRLPRAIEVDAGGAVVKQP